MTEQQERRKRADYVTLIAIYQFVSGALWLIGALAIVVFGALRMVLRWDDWSAVGTPLEVEVAKVTGAVILAVQCFGMLGLGALGIARLVVGFGLLKLSPWARWAAIVLAVLGLGSFPIGTVINVLILIYLLGDEGRAAFESEQ